MTAAVEAPVRVTAGEHFGAWCPQFCRHTMQVPNGPDPGSPLHLEEWQQEFADEALELRWDDASSRWVFVYRTILFVIPRKNGKTSLSSALALYSGGPWGGEVKPRVILAAGSREQAGELWQHATAFIADPQYGSPELAAEFQIFQTGITSRSCGGSITRVAGDGKLNHSKNPSVVIGDELHVWTTPRQIENWKALTTAGGARVAPQVYGLTTAGDDPDGLLALLLARVKEVADLEYGPGVSRTGPDGAQQFSGLRIYRSRDLGVLLYEWSIAPGTPVEDGEAWKAANPASWRSYERIRADLEDPTNDEPTKRRLYGNEWVQGKDAWFGEGAWEALADDKLQWPPAEPITVGVDASLNHDCTAVGWARLLPSGKIAVAARIYAARADAPAHRYFKGGRIKHRIVAQCVAEEAYPEQPRELDEPAALSGRFTIESVAYDPRYFVEQSEMLSEEGYEVIAYEPQSQITWDAVQGFYNAVLEGNIVHDGDPVLAQHVRAAAGQKTERGWKVSKLRHSRPIDGMMAVILAWDLARTQLGQGDYIFAFGPNGEELRPSAADVDVLLGLMPCQGCGTSVSAGRRCPLCGHENSLDDEDEEDADA